VAGRRETTWHFALGRCSSLPAWLTVGGGVAERNGPFIGIEPDHRNQSSVNRLVRGEDLEAGGIMGLDDGTVPEDHAVGNILAIYRKRRQLPIIKREIGELAAVLTFVAHLDGAVPILCLLNVAIVTCSFAGFGMVCLMSQVLLGVGAFGRVFRRSSHFCGIR